jgi:hypothetical protein
LPSVPFASMPDAARVWVFGATQPVLGADAEHLLPFVDGFLRNWVAHGVPVVGGCDWIYDRFLMVAADEHASGVSGCSIDALFRSLKQVESDIGVSLLDASVVFYRDPSGEVQAATRDAFRGLVSMGEVEDHTIVFDNTVGSIGAIRRGEWERPFRESWHARAFRLPEQRIR